MGRDVLVGQIKGQPLPTVVGEFLRMLAETLADLSDTTRGDSHAGIRLNLHDNAGRKFPLTVLRTQDYDRLVQRADRASEGP